jgi:hypothetical protein
VATTEITVGTGDHYCVEGRPDEVERVVLDAARGSIMQLAWFVEVDSGARLGINPDQVVTLRAVAP